MQKAKQSKHLMKEKNSNLKEIEDLRQKRETYEIQKMKVTFKINLDQKCLTDQQFIIYQINVLSFLFLQLAEERATADQELNEVAPKMNGLQETQKSLKKELQEQTKVGLTIKLVVYRVSKRVIATL